MRSKWYNLKEKAINLRKSGCSIREVEIQLGIPRSTLSVWFKNIELTASQKRGLRKNWEKGLEKARVKASEWHRQQKQKRIDSAKRHANKIIDKLDLNSDELLELALAILYLGEGNKKGVGAAIGNSDPLILKYFITIVERNYNIKRDELKCELHLRADQKPEQIKKYWAKELKIPIKNFVSVSIDKRTKGKTYTHYKGVCILRGGGAAVQRRLVFLSREFCKKVIDKHT